MAMKTRSSKYNGSRSARKLLSPPATRLSTRSHRSSAKASLTQMPKARNAPTTRTTTSGPKASRSASAQEASGEPPNSSSPPSAGMRTRRSSAFGMSMTLRQTASRNSSSAAVTSVGSSRTSRKRKAEEDITPSAYKRKRAEIQPCHCVDSPTVNNSAEKQLKAREIDLQKREGNVEKREKAFLKQEEKLKDKEKALKDATVRFSESQARCSTLESKVKDLSDKVDAYVKLVQEITDPSSGHGVPSAQWILANLEEEHQCPLCFEVMASPYGLNHGQCGHTFCALCVLKWSFAALHRDCGLWHDILECPLCRAELSFPVDDQPRSFQSFPFIPARHSDASIRAAVALLKNNVSLSGAASSAGGGAAVKVDDKVAVWAEGGSARLEWQTRDKRGKAEMATLYANWSTLAPIDFVGFKYRYEAL